MSDSQVSTFAESVPTQEHSSSSECSEAEVAFSSDFDDLGEEQDFVVKNTFLCMSDKVELSKLFRNSSAPNILLSCPFELKAPTKLELHDSGECKPCSYLASKDGCHRGSTCLFSHTCPPEELSKALETRKACNKARLLKARKEHKEKKTQAWCAAK